MILGDVFLRNFVSSFDYKKNTISFAVNVKAPAGTLAQSHLGLLDILYICLGGLLAIALVLCCICRKKANKQSSKKLPESNNNQEVTEDK